MIMMRVYRVATERRIGQIVQCCGTPGCVYIIPMPNPPVFSRVRTILSYTMASAALLALLGGCSAVVLSPSGDVAAQQRDLIIIATVLMLIIIIPVMVLTMVFAKRYHNSSDEDYDPDWDHSTSLELVIWAAPLLIIICLGAVTWTGTHRLDPYRPIDRIAAGKPVAKDAKPLDVQVVALDWKWLFIYPEYGIATVNQAAAPVDRPIRFHMTSTSVMNSFYIPALAGQIYAMPGMETKLNAVINKPGNYEGFSANFSGDGFSDMRFRFYGLSDAKFDAWVAAVRSNGGQLDRPRFIRLEQPSTNAPVMRFADVAPDLYEAILNRCVVSGQVCMDDMMRADMATRMGRAKAMKGTDMSAMDMNDAAGPRGTVSDVVRENATGVPLTGAGLPRTRSNSGSDRTDKPRADANTPPPASASSL